MKTLLTLIFVLFTASVASSQTHTLFWDQGEVASVPIAQGFTYKLYVTPTGGSSSMYTLTSVTCTGTAPLANCSAPLPVAASNATLTGTKAELTATDTATGVESPRSSPFIKPAVAPSGLRLTLLERLLQFLQQGKTSLAHIMH